MWLIPTILGGTYVLSSIVFTKNPNLLPNFIKYRQNWRHPKKRWPVNVHISHRGGSGEAYENTMKAFKMAESVGTQMLELDVQLTKDDIVVVSHDQSLLRITGQDLNIKDVNFADLPKIKHEVPIDFAFNQVFSSGDKCDEHVNVPKLEEVFQAFPELCVNVDIKHYNEKLIEQVNDLVIKYDRENRTVWGNFSDKTCRKCYEVNPNIGILFSFSRVLRLLFYFYSGLLPYVTFYESHLEIPMPSVAFRKFDAENMSWKIKALAKMSDFLLMRRSLFEHLDQRGIQTYVWVLNHDEEFERAFKDLKVTGVMTDYPTLLRDFLLRNPQYVKKTL